MLVYNSSSNAVVLEEIGQRLEARRIHLELTQAGLAREAGISKRTVERIEAGGSTQLVSFIRVLRVLGLLKNLDALLPPPQPSPIELLRQRGNRPRRRASSNRERTSGTPWTWGEDE